MLFNSFQFLVFFPIALGIYYLVPQKWRCSLLLGASYYFYMSWEVKYILLIIVSTLVDYFCALKMYQTNNELKRKIILWISLSTNLGMLAVFKYQSFFLSNVQILLDQFNSTIRLPNLDFLLPVGISFYTFQTLSYTIDVYNKKIKPERNLSVFALYVSFFPQLVAGPIERAKTLLPQLKSLKKIEYCNVRVGLLLVMWGFFKKVVIADRLAEFVDTVFKNPHLSDGVSSLIATYCFSFQIYCDFSGYSDIAIGIALIFGIRLMKNFDRPYFSASIGEFWGRWHISLSTWFKDYLYIPIGGSRVRFFRWQVNLMIVFLVSGLWHGANWTFILWGVVHGFYFLMSNVLSRYLNRHGVFLEKKKIGICYKLVKIIFTFHLVAGAWVLFRSNNIADAMVIYTNILNIQWETLLSSLFKNLLALKLPICCILIMETVHLGQELKSFSAKKILESPFAIRWSVYVLLLLTVLLFGRFTSPSQFIYFQF